MRIVDVAIFVVLSIAACVACGGLAAQDPVDQSEAVSPIELDHVVIFAPMESEEEDAVRALQDAGFIVNEFRNEFPDGVLGRYVFFDNAYLELLWLLPGAVTDADTRRSAEGQSTGASPFSSGLRRCKDAPEQLPFPSRAYFAEWMEPGTEMRLLNGEDEVLAPSLFVVPRGMAARDSLETAEWRSQSREEAARALDHSLGARLVTNVRLVTLPAGYPRSTEVLDGTGVSVERGEGPLVEITFDNNSQGKSSDLRPVLPLIVRY